MENVEPLEYLYEMLYYLTGKYGVWGIAAAMFAESAGVPFASAIVLLTSGSMILKGGISFWSIFIASTIGITLGSILSYILGLLGSMLGHSVRSNMFNYNLAETSETATVKPRSGIMRLWAKYGNFSIFMAQLWGFTRTFISYPAGAMHMNFYLFTLYTFLGGSIFSLSAIVLSIAMTGTMGLTLRLIKSLADLSPWLMTIPAVLIPIIFFYFYYQKKKKHVSQP